MLIMDKYIIQDIMHYKIPTVCTLLIQIGHAFDIFVKSCLRRQLKKILDLVL